MKNLQLGYISGKDLADWFGVKEGTFKSTKKKKLEELKNFADFEEKNGKVYITTIYNPVYIKGSKNSYNSVKNKVDDMWNEDGLDTCRRVSQEIFKTYKDELAITESTAYNYTLKARNELYGKPFGYSGSLGSCVYLWCKKEEDGTLRRLTEEEEAIRQDLKKKYFGDATDKQIFVKGMILKGEIKYEEAFAVLEELTNMDNNNFFMFLCELQEKLGCQVIKGTDVTRYCIEEQGVNWENF